MWYANNHSDDENTRWAWLRAVEWINWPIFVSQPIVPVLLYLWPTLWLPITFGVVVLNVAWQLGVLRRFVSVPLADFGCVFVRLKWFTCPAMAYLLWANSLPYHAFAALFWPVAVLLILTIINVPLGLMFKTTDIGPVQNCFMLRLGYSRKTE